MPELRRGRADLSRLLQLWTVSRETGPQGEDGRGIKRPLKAGGKVRKTFSTSSLRLRFRGHRRDMHAGGVLASRLAFFLLASSSRSALFKRTYRPLPLAQTLPSRPSAADRRVLWKTGRRTRNGGTKEALFTSLDSDSAARDFWKRFDKEAENPPRLPGEKRTRREKRERNPDGRQNDDGFLFATPRSGSEPSCLCAHIMKARHKRFIRSGQPRYEIRRFAEKEHSRLVRFGFSTPMS